MISIDVDAYLLARGDGLFDLYKPHRGVWQVWLMGLRLLRRPRTLIL